jgi:methyl-accepting chemotaxis protein
MDRNPDRNTARRGRRASPSRSASPLRARAGVGVRRVPLSRSIARSIELVGTLAHELGAGNLDARANSNRRDEIGDLARAFDTMAGEIRKLRAAERQLLGDVSHELRTPLARMRVVLDLASAADPDRIVATSARSRRI